MASCGTKDESQNISRTPPSLPHHLLWPHLASHFPLALYTSTTPAFRENLKYKSRHTETPSVDGFHLTWNKTQNSDINYKGLCDRIHVRILSHVTIQCPLVIIMQPDQLMSVLGLFTHCWLYLAGCPLTFPEISSISA